jgi:hypothetical protein
MLLLVVVFLAFLAVILFLRHREAMARHQERLAAIEKGLPVPLPENRPSKLPRIYLLRGLQWLFVGLGISLVLLSISATSRQPLSLESKVRTAQLMRAEGASEEQVGQCMKSAGDEMEGMPYAAASLGLVPMSVGLAYLVFYRKESEREEEHAAK